MVTYVNDLRLSELATGEGSGTWGTTTNTNLELIGEALGYATDAISTNADTHATTVADGSTDPGRAMYIKYTGTLDSACTITIGPNTLSRVHIIENATSGSQNIIIKQGSGAEITIPNGFVKAVYLDGAGSGAAVTEAFDNLSVGTNFRVGNGAAEDTSIVFDGNAQDFYVGLDDGDDVFIIGLGSTVGTTPVISIDTNKDITIPDSSLTITTSDNTSQLVLKSTDTDANIGPVFELYRDSASPADNDELGRIYFYGENDNDEKIEYVLFKSNIVDASDGAEGSSLQIFTYSTGGQRNRIDLLEGETVFNEGQQDINFRVESDSNTHAIYLDAGTDKLGIGVSSPIARLSLPAQATGDSGIARIAIESAVDDNDFMISQYEDSSGTYTLIGQNLGLNSTGNDTILDGGHRTAAIRLDARGSGSTQFLNGGTNASAETMRIASDGKVGIGVADGGGLPLHIAVASGDCKLRMETAAKDAFVMELDNSTGALKLGSAATAGAIVIEQDGQVGIGTAVPGGALQIDADSGSEDLFVLNNEKSGSDSGVVTQFRREGTGTGFIANTSSATSYATSQSDRRAKKNFEDWTESVLSHFKDLKPTKFHFTQEDDSSEKNKGYIAQDLVGSFPEAYPLKNDGEDADRYFFNPSGMVVYLMKAIQEQQLLIETLQTEVSALKGA